MLSRKWKRVWPFIVICGTCVSLAAILFVQGRANERLIAGQTLGVFEEAFASKVVDRFGSPRLRVRHGEEVFCVQEPQITDIRSSEVISDFSSTFELNWKLSHVENLADCDFDESTFFVLQGRRPKDAEFANLVEKIVGSKPQDPSSIFPEWTKGLSVSLPGLGYKEFVFTSSYEGVPFHSERSIMLEELLQSILRASDVPSNEIISLLGEDLSVENYKLWFDKNPMGLCSVDIILMELILGPSTSHLRTMEEMRGYLVSNFSKLFKVAETRGENLIQYSDHRCWVW